MAFGYENWKATTLAGVEAACTVNCAADKIIAAADAGESPIRVISADLAHHLGTQEANSYVGRLIRERLGPNFKTALSHRPRKGDVVRHEEHGEGHFHAVRGVALLCRFYMPTGLTPLVPVAPVEVEVFVWTISPEERDEMFVRIADRYLTNTALVPSRSITVEQRQARRRAIRWR